MTSSRSKLRVLYLCSGCGLSQFSNGACLYCGSPTVPAGEDVDPLDELKKLWEPIERALKRLKPRRP